MSGTIKTADSSRSRRTPKALGCCWATPIAVLLVLYVLLVVNNRTAEIAVPTHSVPADNGLDHLHAAYLLSKKMAHMSPYDMPGLSATTMTVANFQACANDAGPTLTEMRHALDLPIVNPPIRSLNMSFHHYAELRELARVNAGAADYYAIAGDPAKALEMRLNGIEMGVMAPRGGTLLTDLVGIACEAIGISQVEPLLPRLSEPELAAAAAHLDRIAAKRTPLSDLVQEEGYANTAEMQEVFKKIQLSAQGIKEANNLFGADFSDPKTPMKNKLHSASVIMKLLAESKRGILEQNLEWYKALAEEAKQPYMLQSRVPVPNNAISDLYSGIIDQWRVKHFGMEGEFAVLQTEVAVYRFKATHGQFPVSLAQLCPEFLPQVPDDPCAGARGVPLKYKRRADGSFLLYSVGVDMVDGGGVPGRYVNFGPGDIVAGKLYTKRVLPKLTTGKAH